MKLILKTGKKLIPLFFLLIFGLVCLLVFFNTDQITERAKTVLIQVLEEQLDEKVEIGSVTLFPLNRVTLHQVTVGTGSEPLAQAERVVVSFYLHNLVKGVDGLVEGIREIQLVKPQVNLIKTDTGYGFEKFLSSSQSSPGNKSLKLTPVIRIIDGNVAYRDDKLNEEVHIQNGSIELKESGVNLNLKAEVASLSQAQFNVKGSLTPEMNLEIDYTDVSLTVLQQYGIQIPEVTELTGIADGSIAVKLSKDGELDYMGQVSIDNGTVRLIDPALVIEHLQTQVSFNKDFAVIQNLEGETSAGNFTLKGQVTDFANPGISLTINTDGLQLAPIEALLEDLELIDPDQFKKVTGSIKGRTEIVGKLDKLTIKANVNFPELTYGDLQLQNLTLNGRFQDSLITIQQLTGKIDEGKFEVYSGYFDLKDLDKISYSTTLDIKDLQLQRILSVMDLGLQDVPEGKLNGRCYLSGEGFDYDQVTAIGSLEVLDGKYQQMPFDKFKTSFWLSAGDLGLSKVELSTPYLTTELSGNIDLDGEMYLTIEPSFINLGWFSELFDLPANGEGQISGQVGGTIQNPYFQGQVSMNQGHLWNQQFDSMSGGIRIDKEELVLTDALVSKGDNVLEITGKVGFARENLDLKLNVSKSSLEDLKEMLDFMDIPFEITGDITGQIALEGTWTDLQVKGDLMANNGTAAKQPYNSAELSFTWDDNDIFFENFKVSYQNTILQASGMLDDYKNLDIEMVGQNFDLNDIQQMRDHLPQIKGRANFRGKLTGELSSPSFWGTISSDSITYNDIPVEQLSALLNFEDGVLNIKPMKVMNAGSEYTLIGEICFDDKTMEMNIQNKGSQVSDLLRYTGLPVKQMDYILGGEIWVRGDLNRPVFDLDVTLADGKDGVLALTGIYDLDQGMNFQIEGTNFDLSSSKVYLGLDKFNYTLNGSGTLKGKFEEITADMDIQLQDPEGGQLLVTGVYGLKDGMNLTLDGKMLDMVQLKAMIPVELDYTGKLNINGTLNGQLDRLNASLRVGIEKGTINDYPLKYLGGSIQLSEGSRVLLDQKLELLDGSTLTVNGHLPLKDFGQTIDLNVDMPRGNLVILPVLLPGVEKAGGQGKAHFKLTGVLAKPLIEGEVDINSGFVDYTGLEMLQEINGKILLSKDRIMVNNLNAKYGDGTVEVTGRIILDGLIPDELLLTAKTHNVHFAYGSVDANGDGTLSVRGKLMQPEIRGKLTVHDTTVKVLPSFDWPASDEPSEFAPTFYLELYPGENVRVTGESPLNMNLTLLKNPEQALVIDSTGEELIITGDLASRSGTFNIYNSNFRVSQASASFVEFNKYIPILNINAYTTINDYRIYVVLDGLPTDSENFNWNLTSDPPLSQEQITTLLAGQGGLGGFLDGSRDVTALITDEMWRYINQGLRSEFLNKLEESVEKAFNLDSFYIDPVLFGDAKINIQVGKYLNDNFYVVYKRTFAQDPEQSFGFEYEIRSNISLEGVYKDEGDYQISLKADFPF